MALVRFRLFWWRCGEGGSVLSLVIQIFGFKRGKREVKRSQSVSAVLSLLLQQRGCSTFLNTGPVM